MTNTRIFDEVIEMIAKDKDYHKDKARLELADKYREWRCKVNDQDKLHSLMRRAYAHHKEWSGFMRQMSYYLIDYKNRQHLPQYKKQEDD